MRHDGDLLYDLFQEVWDFNEAFDSGSHGYDLLLVPVNDLHLSLHEVLGVLADVQFHLLHNAIAIHHDFLDLGIPLVNGDNLLFESRNLLDLLVDDGDLDGSLSDSLDHLVHVDYNGDFHGEFDELRYLYHFLEEPFDFINSRDFIIGINDSLNDGRNFSDGLLDLRNRFSDSGLDLLDGFIIVGYGLLDLLDHLTHDWLLDYIDYLLHANFLTSYLHNLLHLLDHLHYLLYFTVDGDDPLDDAVHGDWNFNGDDGGSFDLDYLLHLDDLGDDAFHGDLLGDIDTDLNNLLHLLGDHLHHLYDLLNGHDLLDDLLDYSFDLVEDVLDHLYFNDLVLDDGHLDDLLHLNNLLYFHDAVYYFLDDLRHLNDLLDYSRYHNNLLHDLLHFNDLGYFHHLLDDLIDIHSDLFDSFDCSGYFYDLLDDDLDGIGLVDVVIDWFFDFDDLLHFYDLVDALGDLDDLGYFHSFHHDLCDYLRHTDYLLLVEGYLNSPVYDLLHFLDEGHCVVDHLLHLFDPIAVDDLLLDLLDLLDGGYFHSHLDYFLDCPGYFHDLLDHLDHGHCLLDDHLNDLGEFDHVVDHLSGVAVLDHLHWFLDDAVEGLDDLANHLHDLLMDYFHLHNFSHYPLHGDELLPDDFHFVVFGDSVIDDALHIDWLLNFNDLLDDYFHLNDLGDFDDAFDYLLDDAGHFHDLLGVVGYFHYLLDDVVHILDDLHWNVDDLLHLLDADYLHWLLDDPLDSDHLRYLHYSFHDLLNDLLHLDDLRHHTEDL